MKVSQNLIQFEGEFQQGSGETKELKTKIRKSYAGGFRMFKSPELSTPQESFRNLKKEIEDLKEKTRQVKTGKKNKDFVEVGYHIEENKYIEDIRDIEQLQHLKEQKAKRIVEIEAELRRSRIEENRGKNVGKTEGDKKIKAKDQENKYVKVRGGKIVRSDDQEWKNKELNEIFHVLDTGKVGFISLTQVTNEISQNLDLAELLNIPKELTDINEIYDYLLMIAKTLNLNSEKLNLEDFFSLLEFTDLNRSFRLNSPRVCEPKCVLPNQVVFIFENVFDSFFSDAVDKFAFLDSLLANFEIQSFLSQPAVKVSDTEVADLASVLHYIRIDNSNSCPTLTWHEFLTYFYLTSPQIPKKCLDLFRDIFESISAEPNSKISTYDLLSTLNSSPDLIPFLQFPLSQSESIYEVLLKIQDHAPAFITLTEFLSFFTQKSEKKFQKSLQKNFKSTKIEPFAFEARESQKKDSKISIREKKLKEMLEEKAKIEEFHLNYRPKPNIISKCIKQPLYEQMIERQKMRSEEIKKNSIERTLKLEKPFSFYERDKLRSKPEPSSPKVYRFKAKPIPRSSSVPLFEKMMMGTESSRKERVAARAQELLRESSLPPRMQLYSNHSKSVQNLVVDEMSKFRFRPKDPPEFKKLHEKFAKTLESKKQARKKTEIEPFTIDERAEEIREKRKKEKSETQKVETPKQKSFKARDPPDFPKLYKSFQRNLEKKKVDKKPLVAKPFGIEDRVKEMKEKKEKFEEENKKKVEEKREKEKELEDRKVDKNKVGNLKGLKDKLQKAIFENIEKSKEKGGDLESKARKKKIDAEEQARKYKESLKEMNARVYNKPLLIDIEAQTTSVNLAKGKALHSIKSQLKSSGLLSKNYFTAEEQALIELFESNNP